MSLALFTVNQKNRKTWTLPYSQTVLLNSRKVIDFKADPANPTTKTIIYYIERESDRVYTTELNVTHTPNTVHSRLKGGDPEEFMWLEVTHIQNGRGERPVAGGSERMKVNQAFIVKAYNIDAASSYVYLERGPSEVIRLRTSHTVEDIGRSYSKSTSLSTSF